MINYCSFVIQIYESGKKNVFVDAGEPESSNWLRYVNCGRDEAEMNLKAFQYKNKVR